MKQFSIKSLSIEGLYLLKREHHTDSRGNFSRLFCDEELASVDWNTPIRQINMTRTTAVGTVRGLHYQNQPHSEMKIVNCLKGAIWDVVVDLRRGSDTFLEWHSEILSEENQFSLSIPRGFAHGFQTLTPEVELLYFHSSPYKSDAEAGLRYNDPTLNVNWPMEVTKISERDLGHPLLEKSFKGVDL